MYQTFSIPIYRSPVSSSQRVVSIIRHKVLPTFHRSFGFSLHFLSWVRKSAMQTFYFENTQFYNWQFEFFTLRFICMQIYAKNIPESLHYKLEIIFLNSYYCLLTCWLTFDYFSLFYNLFHKVVHLPVCHMLILCLQRKTGLKRLATGDFPVFLFERMSEFHFWNLTTSTFSKKDRHVHVFIDAHDARYAGQKSKDWLIHVTFEIQRNMKSFLSAEKFMKITKEAFYMIPNVRRTKTVNNSLHWTFLR